MVSTPPRPPAVEPPPTTAFAALAQGWRLWRQAPLPVFVVAWLPLAGSLVFGLVPGIGGLLSTIASGLLSVVAWLCLDAAARGGDPAPGTAFAAAARRPPVLAAMATVAALLGVAMAMAIAPALGLPVQQVLLAGLPEDTRPTPEMLAGALAVAPVAWLLQWIAPRMLFAGATPLQAFVDCFAALARRPVLVLGFAGASVALGLLGLVTVVGIGLVLPWLTATSYAVYQGVFGDDAGTRGTGGRDRASGDDGTLAA